MVNEKTLRKSFARVKHDMSMLNLGTSNNLRYLNQKVQEQDYRIKQLERRLAQIERITLNQKIIR